MHHSAYSTLSDSVEYMTKRNMVETKPKIIMYNNNKDLIWGPKWKEKD